MKLILKLIENSNILNLQKWDSVKIESCKLANVKESSRYYLDEQWEKGGYNGLIPHYGGERKSKLKEDEITELNNILKTKESLLVNDVIQLIKEQFGVQYKYHAVRNLLIKLNIPITNYFENENRSKVI